MRTKEYLLSILSVAALALLLSCSSDSNVAGGGGTDYPNTKTVAGVLVDSRNLPVANARVLLIDKQILAGAEIPGDSLRDAALDTQFTASNGAYAFDSVNAGTYDIEAVNSDSTLIAYVASLHKAPDSALIVDTTWMFRPGSLTGRVVVRKDVVVVVIINGTYYRTVVDSQGVYHFPFLPPGAVSIDILVLDTANGVAAQDTSLAGSVTSDSAKSLDSISLSPIFSWPHARKMTLNTTRTGCDVRVGVRAFPVALTFTATSFDFSTAAGDGSNIRFASITGTPLSHEIESWDSLAGQGAVWVRFDTIYADSIQPFYMYWGKTGQLDLSDPETVFDTSAGFRAVWHLSEEALGTGMTDVYKDATALGSHGDDFVGSPGKEGVIGRGQQFNGTSDYIVVQPGVFVNGPLTVSAWIKERYIPDTSSNRWFNIVGTYNLDAANDFYSGFGLSCYESNLIFTAGDGTVSDHAGNWAVMTSTEWVHVAAVYAPDSGRVRFYRNGAPLPDADAFTKAVLAYGSSSRTFISKDTRDGFDGSVDEVRIDARVRSPEWIKLCYDNQKIGQALVR